MKVWVNEQYDPDLKQAEELGFISSIIGAASNKRTREAQAAMQSESLAVQKQIEAQRAQENNLNRKNLLFITAIGSGALILSAIAIKNRK